MILLSDSVSIYIEWGFEVTSTDSLIVDSVELDQFLYILLFND